jgi:predicted nucleic acid-binding protein
MAFPTAVNSQITDAVTQANVQVLGVAPAQALAMLEVALSHSLALAAANAVTQQQNANILMDAVSARSVARILGAGK